MKYESNKIVYIGLMFILILNIILFIFNYKPLDIVITFHSYY